MVHFEKKKTQQPSIWQNSDFMQLVNYIIAVMVMNKQTLDCLFNSLWQT